MVEMHADDRIPIEEAQAGDIIAMVGLKNVRTGNTLADPKDPATLEPMVFPDPVISVAIKPKDKHNSEKLGVALGKMVQEDPSFRVEVDDESGETILKGMGELHLDIKVDILKRTHGVEVSQGASRRWPTGRRITKLLGRLATPIRSRRVVPVSSRRSTTSVEPLEAGRGLRV